MGVSMAAAIILAAASPQTGTPPDTLDVAVAAIFAPYSGPSTATASWGYPIYSQQTAQLIGRWRAVTPQDEPDALSDSDWLCLCQEFDREAFKAAILSKRAGRGGTVVSVQLDLGHGARRGAQLVLKREGGIWKLDDLYATPDFPNGLKQKLQETILENSVP
jgi:hypothetical protein